MEKTVKNDENIIISKQVEFLNHIIKSPIDVDINTEFYKRLFIETKNKGEFIKKHSFKTIDLQDEIKRINLSNEVVLDNLRDLLNEIHNNNNKIQEITDIKETKQKIESQIKSEVTVLKNKKNELNSSLKKSIANIQENSDNLKNNIQNKIDKNKSARNEFFESLNILFRILKEPFISEHFQEELVKVINSLNDKSNIVEELQDIIKLVSQDVAKFTEIINTFQELSTTNWKINDTNNKTLEEKLHNYNNIENIICQLNSDINSSKAYVKKKQNEITSLKEIVKQNERTKERLIIKKDILIDLELYLHRYILENTDKLNEIHNNIVIKKIKNNNSNENNDDHNDTIDDNEDDVSGITNSDQIKRFTIQSKDYIKEIDESSSSNTGINDILFNDDIKENITKDVNIKTEQSETVDETIMVQVTDLDDKNIDDDKNLDDNEKLNDEQ